MPRPIHNRSGAKKRKQSRFRPQTTETKVQLPCRPTATLPRRRFKNVNSVVHRIEPKALAARHHFAARFVVVDERVPRVLLPMDTIGRPGDIGVPRARNGLAAPAAMVDRVVGALMLDHLIN